MAFDEHLADRVRDLMPRAEEKRMFGGVGWMERGKLVVGVSGDELMVRLGPDWEKALQHGVRPFGGKAPMKGWVLVDQENLAEDDDLSSWIEKARAFVATLA